MSEEVESKPQVEVLVDLKSEPLDDVRPRSPESNCAICLEGFNNKSYINTCLHEFCFNCIKEWSRIKPECPLCKQRFTTVIHSIVGPQDYQEYTVEPQNPFDALFVNMSHQPTFRAMAGLRESLERISSSWSSNTGRMMILRQTETPESTVVSFRYVNDGSTNVPLRRDVYRRNRWIRPNNSNRVRECSPDFFRLNPAQSHRLVPWLHRELHVLLDVALEPNEMITCILQLICVYPIRSRQFREALVPALGTHTDHFLHEFYHFAVSPHDIHAHDNTAEYSSPGRESPTQFPQLHFSSDTDDTDVEVVQPVPRPRPPRPKPKFNLTECILDLTNRAGPSNSGASSSRPANINDDTIIIISDTSSDSEVEIIEVKPPTPITIMIPSTDSEAEVVDDSPQSPPERMENVARGIWPIVPSITMGEDLSLLSSSSSSSPSSPVREVPIRPSCKHSRSSLGGDSSSTSIHSLTHSTTSSSSSSSSSTSSTTTSSSSTSRHSPSPPPSVSVRPQLIIKLHPSLLASHTSASSSSESDYCHTRSTRRTKKRKRSCHTKSRTTKKPCPKVDYSDSSS